jgi:hypothetical protein
VLLGVVGLALSVVATVPPMYVHLTDKRYEKLFPVLPIARDFLKQVTMDRCVIAIVFTKTCVVIGNE